MLNVNYVHLMVLCVVVLFALILYVVRVYARQYFLSLTFLGFSIIAVFITMAYLPYFGVVPSGTVVIPTNFTTVFNGTTTVFTNVSMTKTIYTVAGDARFMAYLGVTVALVAGVIGFLLLVMAAMRQVARSAYRGWRRR